MTARSSNWKKCNKWKTNFKLQLSFGASSTHYPSPHASRRWHDLSIFQSDRGRQRSAASSHRQYLSQTYCLPLPPALSAPHSHCTAFVTSRWTRLYCAAMSGVTTSHCTNTNAPESIGKWRRIDASFRNVLSIWCHFIWSLFSDKSTRQKNQSLKLSIIWLLTNNRGKWSLWSITIKHINPKVKR